MAQHQIIGTFDSVERARHAQTVLIMRGLSEAQIAISIDITADDIAAEAPGQSYENQPRDNAKVGGGWLSLLFGQNLKKEKRLSHLAESARSGGCVVTAEARTLAEADLVRQVMEELQALDISTASKADQRAKL